MRRFSGFLLKEFLHILRDTRTMLILFLIPIFQILIFGYVIKNEVKDAKIGIIDMSHDNVTEEITARLDAAVDFNVVREYSNYEEAEAGFRANEIKAVVVFADNFANDLGKYHSADVQILLDASDPNLANLINSYISVILNKYTLEKNKTGTSALVSTEPRMWFNENLHSAYMFVPGTMALILMLITALMSSISIAREKETGTMEILLVSPLKPIQIILGKLTPYAVLSIVNVFSILFIGNVVFGVPVNGSWVLLLLSSFLFILLALSLGLLISTLVKTQQTAMFISILGLMLPTMLLSGFIFPIENMPVILQYLSYIVPAKYFLVIIKSIMLKGLGLDYIINEVLILSGIIVGLIALCVVKFKMRLE